MYKPSFEQICLKSLLLAFSGQGQEKLDGTSRAKAGG